MKSDKLISLETERACLASLIKYNNFIADVLAFVKPEYFSVSIHSTIYSLITSTYQEKGSVDQILLVAKLNQFNIKEIEGIDIYRYIQVLYNSPTNQEYVLDYFKELIKYYFLRNTDNKLEEAKKHIYKYTDRPLNQLINEVSQIVTDAATGNIDDSDIIVDLYGSLISELTQRAKEQKNPCLLTKFPVFDRWYGGISFADLYIFAAPAKRGKSTFLNYLAYQMAAEPSNNLKVLYLDTEMETWRVQCRAASSLTEINEWLFKSGKFANDRHLCAKVNEMYKTIEPVKGRVFHLYVGNRSIDEIIAIARRWYVKNVKEGENALIAYDYIKLDGDGTKLSEFYKEYQAIGEKTDKLKKFSSSYDNMAVISSVQTNAECDIAMSQRIKWYASNVFILKPKELEDIQSDGLDRGTHKLIEVVARIQGEEAQGMTGQLLKVKDHKGNETYTQNYINLDFNKFKVTEVGTLEDCLKQQAQEFRTGKDNFNEDF